jgi:putative transposase
MAPPTTTERYKNHRLPGEIISDGIWLYYRFPLSYRDVQELLLARGIDVTHEAIRQWCLKFGQVYANQLRRRRAQPGDKWHLDEVFLRRCQLGVQTTFVQKRSLTYYTHNCSSGSWA